MSFSPATPRMPGMVHLAIGLLIILVLIPLALKVEQAPPPTIAEFAPQVRQQVKDPPKDQAANVGQLGGVGGGGGQFGVLPSPSASIDPLVAASAKPTTPRYHRCVGNPPRQIEDPQSPPCVAYWEGNNGGATAKGVTGSTITVVLEKTQSGGNIASNIDMVNFLNDRFEFYGRKIVLQYYDQSTGATGPEAQAAQEDAQFQPFAHWGVLSTQTKQTPDSQYWYDAYARHHIISTVGEFFEFPAQSQAHMTQNAPYQWMYTPSYDQVERNLGEMWCKDFKDKAPVYAGTDVTSAFKTRTLQVYVSLQGNPDDPSAGSAPMDTQPLVAALSGCGTQALFAPEPPADAQKWQAAAVQARQNHVTTVVCLCGASDYAGVGYNVFSSQQYHPEWINTNIINLDSDAFDQDGSGPTPSDQYPYILGLHSYNKTLSLQDQPWWWAVKEADPAYASIGSWNTNSVYWALLLIASGIQEAGPHLTPRTFEQGLMQTQFPNPGADGPPYYQARVGFGPGNHSMINTLAPVWWDQNQPSYDYFGSSRATGQGSPGAYCYINHGARYALGEWPADMAFRQSPCR